MKEFEWDESKRRLNLEKHNIDFAGALRIFEDKYRIEAELIKNNELRYITMGEVENVVLLLVYTRRGKKIRLISARRASKKERVTYFEAR